MSALQAVRRSGRPHGRRSALARIASQRARMQSAKRHAGSEIAGRRAQRRVATTLRGGRERVEPFLGAPIVGDFASARVRAAGGPTDEALYTCDCGYIFRASVSTTVACPHCGSEQAW
jgi:hypothetical protein